MDRELDQSQSYLSIVLDVVHHYAQYQPSLGNIELQAIVDGEHYLLMSFGWNGDRRVHSIILHLRIVDDKIWIERDETEEGIAHDLLARGVKQDDIVLAFYHPDDRKLTDFAIA